MSAWSFTSIVYVPGVSVVTSLPLASFRLMSKPGPTLPFSVVPVAPPVPVVVVSVVVASVVPEAELSLPPPQPARASAAAASATTNAMRVRVIEPPFRRSSLVPTIRAHRSSGSERAVDLGSTRGERV